VYRFYVHDGASPPSEAPTHRATSPHAILRVFFRHQPDARARDGCVLSQPQAGHLPELFSGTSGQPPGIIMTSSKPAYAIAAAVAGTPLPVRDRIAETVFRRHRQGASYWRAIEAARDIAKRARQAA
jgi:hypothetical protein